jgi:hypothetical protein
VQAIRALITAVSGKKSIRKCINSDIQKSCQPPKQKIFRFRRRANQMHDSARLTRQEGRIMTVMNVRWDAVDAGVPITNGADAYGEIVWS